MPYYITDKSEECSGWAVVKVDGEVLGCHDTKESAIDQAVAISIDTDEPFEGERAAVGSLNTGDWVSWSPLDPTVLGKVAMIQDQFAVVEIYEYEKGIFTTDEKFMLLNVFKLEKVPAPTMLAVELEDEPDQPEVEDEGEANLPDNYRPALSEDVPEGRACGNCFFYDESRLNAEGNKAWCERWDAFVDGGYYCNAWQANDEDRAINQAPPAYMRAAARRGLEYYDEGLAGDGVTPGTIREARAMANGEVSDDKWIRIAAWIARHLADLDAPDADPSSENYPSAGVVAHLLWGSGPTKRAAQRTQDYADSVVARIRAEETNSMETKNKWLDVARAIALKIDGPQVKEPEVRVNTVELEVRENSTTGMSFTGYASVFNSPSEDLGGFIEYVAPGAFKRSLQSRNEIKLLWNHDSGEPLASLRGGTMQLVEDERGLKVTATLPQTTRGKDVAELLRTKVIDSMSFGFNVIKDSWSSDGKTRTLESVRLSEVSIVSFPAYSKTTATVRSAEATIDPDKLADALLRLESGDELDDTQASLITDVVSKLKSQPETEQIEDHGLDLLDLKKKQFDLLLKRI
jgi:uncharacterized protein